MQTLPKPDLPLVSRFVASVQEPKTPHISPKRVAEALGIPLSNLALLTGCHRNTMRNPTSDRLQTKLREIVSIISTAARIAGDTDKALYWFRNEPIGDYDNKTAETLVAEGHGEAVRLFLLDLENGATG